MQTPEKQAPSIVDCGMEAMTVVPICDMKFCLRCLACKTVLRIGSAFVIAVDVFRVSCLRLVSKRCTKAMKLITYTDDLISVTYVEIWAILYT